ncbi:MAG: RagB/SusD family nutrient uptake outer membrane protein [Cytophagales bacterium]|nr:RagB/SusD family nutrient uptake outer membrane protein [Cytophagales bacterium]
MEKTYKNITVIGIAFILLLSTSCTDFLQEEVYTQYDPDAFLQTEQGINSVLVSAYDNLHSRNVDVLKSYNVHEWCGDIMWEYAGGYNAATVPFSTFTWDAQTALHSFDTQYRGYYVSIRNANSLLDEIDNVTSLPVELVSQLKAEARFIRAASYYFLWDLFGPVPLITSAATLDFEPLRATEDEFDKFITSELTAAADELPVNQDLWGKATKGAALALLGKYYLNSKQWQKAADLNLDVMELDQYSLYSGDLKNMFAVENEENEEVIFANPALPILNPFMYMAGAFPPNYPVLSNWRNWGAQFCVRNDWVQTYHPDDKRRDWFLFEYVDTKGNYHDLLDPADKGRAVRCFKFVPDPNAIDHRHGNDVPSIRYAEVLLNRAEALNEINGPTQESIDLLNQVRQRAGVPLYSVSDFVSKDELRDALLDERGWEFVVELQRRRDLIRHGKFISSAIDRGATNAKDYMVRYPIPIVEENANPNIEQNPGY